MSKTPSALTRARGERSQQDLAAELDVTQATISHWETGVAAPPLKDWNRIAGAYGVKLSVLLKHFAAVTKTKATEAKAS